jgi:formylglycine-generating enzyme required for sulfatase activity
MIPCLNPACKYINVPDTKFCIKCGTKLLIQDRYRPLKEISTRVFGQTLLAVDQSISPQSLCVIKQFIFDSGHPHLRKKAQELFYEEVKQLGKLGKHPQIPELFGCHEQENRLYLIQEFIEGENLREELDRNGAFSAEQVWQILRELLPVVEFIHDHQVIHRDIKPENIIRRCSDQKLILIDFGAVKQTTITNLRRTGTKIGSPAYQAPEQGMGKAIFSSDIYSLGVSCLQLLTNMEPFDLYDVHERKFVWRHYLLNNPVADSLGEILDKMTQVIVKQRYQSAQEVMQILSPPSPKIAISTIPNISAIPTIPTTPQVFSLRLETTRISKISTIYKTSGKDFIEDLGGGFLGDEIRLEMVAIPGGRFLMGSPITELGRNQSESPCHEVSVQPFYLGKYAVTQEQYQLVMGNHSSRFKGKKLPMERVSWEQSVQFCQKLSQKTGRVYRLPSEAEWEYACRARTTTPFFFGDTVSPEIVNYHGKYPYGDTPKGLYRQQTIALGFPNTFELYDMHGNIWEWCSDRWHANYDQAPTDGSSWEAGTNNSRVLRGGSWQDKARHCRSARRHWSRPDICCDFYGFRVACSGTPEN